MKILGMSAVCWLALTTHATAMTGEALFVLGDNVNVRRAPTLEAPVKRQFDRGERLFERSRDGDWIEVGNEKIGDPLGWVHGSLVSRVSPKVVSSKREAAGTEDEVLILMRRMSTQIDELSREVQDLREEVRALKSDVGHLDNRVTRLR